MTKPHFINTFNEDNLQWNTNSNERGPLTEDGLQWKTTFNGRQPLKEDDLQWKTISNGRRPPMEENLKIVEYLSKRCMYHDLWFLRGKLEENSEEFLSVALLSAACFIFLRENNLTTKEYNIYMGNNTNKIYTVTLQSYEYPSLGKGECDVVDHYSTVSSLSYQVLLTWKICQTLCPSCAKTFPKAWTSNMHRQQQHIHIIWSEHLARKFKKYSQMKYDIPIFNKGQS